MDIDTIRLALEPFVNFFVGIIFGGFTASTVVEFLKVRLFPDWFSRFPRVTNMMASVIVTLVAIYVSPDNLHITKTWEVAAMVLGVMVTSAIFYNNIYRGLSTRTEVTKTSV